ncbi:MAG: hypothetical protein AMXMBFR84_11020 [Candidatus Hydrogenedentota bacterium]
MRRRQFLKTAGAGLGSLCGLAHSTPGGAPPNILWLTCEDMSPNLGCYGDGFAATPNVDAFATRSLRYTHCWSNAPVCAPARTTIITGMYPPSLGAEHMRSSVGLPPEIRLYPQYLRDAGYYCTNNVKEDFNVVPNGPVWDDVSKDAHWKNAPEGKPFFAIFNQTCTHESQIRTRPHPAISDPAKVPVPPYHPDAPEVRQDWAQYYDNIREMDAWVGERLKELEEAGLADDTIVFFYSDHGSGMPRSKRWLYQSGLHVPMIVHVPEKFRHLAPEGYEAHAVSDRLIGFVDLAPTVLSLAGLTAPEHMQGAAFMGAHAKPEPAHLYGFRGRMDERPDLSRAVRDKNYLYIRNYMPHRPQGQHQAYMFETPTTAVWKRMYDEGKLDTHQRRFWEAKAPEELYDLAADPFQLTNLAGRDTSKDVLEGLRQAHRQWAIASRDLSLLPEPEMLAMGAESTPYAAAQDPDAYPIEDVLAMADRAAGFDSDAIRDLVRGMSDATRAVRFWAATGLTIRGAEAVAAGREDLRRAMAEDVSHAVRTAAAEALGLHGNEEDVSAALSVLIELADARKHGYLAALPAVDALDRMDGKAKPAADAIAKLVEGESVAPERSSTYLKRIVDKAMADLAD